jgi:phospholipid/cholesterol/gamma-HCH transport system substrate-binding protein
VGAVDNVVYEKGGSAVRVEMSVGAKYAEMIRNDSVAEIATQGILGDKYIAISGGTPQESVLPSGSEIKNVAGKGITQFLSKSDELIGNLNSITRTLDRILKTFESNKRAETLFAGLAATSRNLSLATEKINRDLDHMKLKEIGSNLKEILSKINDGTGTLGALVNDPDLYFDLRALLGGVNRNRIMRNLVRQTVQDAKAAKSDKSVDSTS